MHWGVIVKYLQRKTGNTWQHTTTLIINPYNKRTNKLEKKEKRISPRRAAHIRGVWPDFVRASTWEGNTDRNSCWFIFGTQKKECLSPHFLCALDKQHTHTFFQCPISHSRTDRTIHRMDTHISIFKLSHSHSHTYTPKQGRWSHARHTSAAQSHPCRHGKTGQRDCSSAQLCKERKMSSSLQRSQIYWYLCKNCYSSYKGQNKWCACFFVWKRERDEWKSKRDKVRDDGCTHWKASKWPFFK